MTVDHAPFGDRIILKSDKNILQTMYYLSLNPLNPRRRNIVAEKIREDPRGDDVSSPMKLRESPGDSLVAFPKLKRQVVLYTPEVQSPKDFDENTQFWINQEFSLVKNGKLQKRGKMNLVGRLQLSTERSKEEDNESIVQLRILRVQEAIIKILKMRKRITNAQLQTELVDILKNMFLPSKKMIKEQIEWLIEHKYMRRDEDDINTFIYMA
ncbi:Cullin-5 [Homalodisca vitripennis]|nr:Cullin-5 [Homalodisca vitripennis]